MSNETEPTPTSAVVVYEDNGKPALYNPAAFHQIWRAAQMFAKSDLVPSAYKGKPENCFIAIEMADRMGISPFAMLQSLVIIQGKPSMEAKLIIAMVNDSGIFVDPLEYEIVGEDAYAKDYKVRCFATMKKTGKVCYGPWIDYRMVEGEGWLAKQGSKWKTMPSIMFMYRAASYFAKVYCPNITMGMQTREEMDDVRPPVDITPVPNLVAALESKPADAVVEAVEGTDEPPPLAGVSTEPETPKRERGKPSPGHAKRTKQEMEEDKAADEAEALAAQQAADAMAHGTEAVDTGTGEITGGEPDLDDNFPDLPGTQAQQQKPTDDLW